MTRLSEAVPDHPVVLRGLHSFAVWGNRLAFTHAGITADTPDPTGGEIRRDAGGQPTGILVNNAGQLLMDAMPAPSDAQLAARVSSALRTLAAAGYTGVHEAGADAHLLRVLDQMAAADALPIRVYAMLALRDKALIDEWLGRGPLTDPGPLVVRSVKAFYDGAMGSRGAFFLDDYSDRPGHRGTGGADYGFDRDRMAALMRAGFQVVIHAIARRPLRRDRDHARERSRAGELALEALRRQHDATALAVAERGDGSSDRLAHQRA
jgi:predicted amidohydrolase YtcJ